SMARAGAANVLGEQRQKNDRERNRQKRSAQWTGEEHRPIAARDGERLVEGRLKRPAKYEGDPERHRGKAEQLGETAEYSECHRDDDVAELLVLRIDTGE